jgi:acyl-CoA reductase-like NAD-dependent aldehyde dehydrogenase
VALVDRIGKNPQSKQEIFLMQEFHLLINGQLTAGASTMDVINPATGERLTQCPRADAKQLESAVAAASAAFAAWSGLSIETRRAKILAIANAVEARIDEFTQLLTAEQGKPLGQAKGEMFGTVAIIRTLANLNLAVKTLKEDANATVVEHRTPLGVVAAITPWNFPMVLLAVKIAPALLAGNTIVVKPAPTTPLTSLLLGEICNEHLPPGVLNVITDQNDLGDLLTQHPSVAKVSFTGSTATGRRVMASAATTLKRLTLELGGNDVAIVLDDADTKMVAAQIFTGAMLNAGQVCLAIKRVYVHDSLYDAFCVELAALADAAVVADGSRPGTTIGPLQNKLQFERVKALIDDARKEGKIIAGGTVLDGPGFFIRPTIVRDIPDTARLVREEQFGPVLPVLKFASVDEVLQRANDSIYGLGGTVWSGDAERALAVALKINTGIVWINSHMVTLPDVAMGGAKHSGIGTELGLQGLEEFTQRHVVYVPKQGLAAPTRAHA